MPRIDARNHGRRRQAMHHRVAILCRAPERDSRVGVRRRGPPRSARSACVRAPGDYAAGPGSPHSARRGAAGGGPGRRPWIPSRRGGCIRPRHIFRRSFRSLPRANRAKMSRARCKRCARRPPSRRRMVGSAGPARQGTCLPSSDDVTTDLFIVAAGLEARALRRAVPPDCLRGVDPAPTATQEGDDTVFAPPPWTPRRSASHLLPAFAPLTDAPLAFRFEMCARVDGGWSPWVAGVTVGDAAFAPLPAAAPPLACDIDVFSAVPAVEAVRLRLRVRGVLGARWLLALSAADAAAPPRSSSNGATVRL